MARKYTKVTYNGDEATIKAILKARNIDYIKIYYVRDDRIINLLNNTVDIGNYNAPNMVTTSRYNTSIVACSPLKEAEFVDDTIVGKQVRVELLDSGLIEIRLENRIFADFRTGRFDFDDKFTRENFIEDVSCINGLEEYLDGIIQVFHTYPMYGINTVFQKWYVVYMLNLFDKLDEYSHLISYFSPHGTNLSASNMFDAFNIDQMYMPVLSNYFIPICENSRGAVYGFTREGVIHSIFNGIIMEDCKIAMLDAAENEKINLLTLYGRYSSDRDHLVHCINTYPNYFIEFISKNNRNQAANIFTEFTKSIQTMQALDIEPNMFNYANMHFAAKASRYNMDMNEYCNLISQINTKEGLLEYLRRATI
jgi:hypothetical protein